MKRSDLCFRQLASSGNWRDSGPEGSRTEDRLRHCPRDTDGLLSDIKENHLQEVPGL